MASDSAAAPVFPTRITKMLKVDHPVMLAGMAGVALAELTAAVCNAGGFGCMGGGVLSPTELRAEIRKLKSLTSRPFGVDILATNANLMPLVQVVIEEGAAAFVTGLGTKREVIEACRRAGVLVGCVCGKVSHAVKAVELGCDFVIAQGTEGGGHTGEVALLPLLPQVVDAIGARVPVVAAGGIFDGRGLLAALSLGADAVWMGTRFLATHEARTVRTYKERLLAISSNDTVITKAYTGKTCRVMRNKFTDEVARSGRDQLEVYRSSTVDEHRSRIHLGHDERTEIDPDREFMPCGQAAGAIKSIVPAGQLVTEIVSQAAEQLRRVQRARL